MEAKILFFVYTLMNIYHGNCDFYSKSLEDLKNFF